MDTRRFAMTNSSLVLLLLLGILCVVEGQFKIVDSSNFRTKKGVANNSSSSIAFVQINHYANPTGEQSRAFSIQQGADDPNLIKVHIQYKNKIDQVANGNLLLSTDVEADASPSTNPSTLRRIMDNNKKRDKYNPLRKFKTRPQLMSRNEVSSIEMNPVHRELIMQENKRILKKLNIHSDVKKYRPTKVSTFVSSCRCIPMDQHCAKRQITVARCTHEENLCCF